MKKYYRIILSTIIIISFFLILGLLFFSPKNYSPLKDKADKKINIVASFFVLADFAREIGGQYINVETLFLQTPEVSSLTSNDILKLQRADLIVINGADFEVALKDILNSEVTLLAKTVDTSKNIELINNDPHFWLDPYRALIQAYHIKDALVKIDPDHKDYYEQNLEIFAKKLRDLDLKISQSLKNFGKKDFVAFHNAFIYFNERYQLNQVATIEEFTGKEPSVSYLASVINKIKKFQVKTIFSEPQFSPKIVETIAKDLGLKVYTLDPIETGNLQKDSYFSKMEENLNSLIKAFRENQNQ